MGVRVESVSNYGRGVGEILCGVECNLGPKKDGGGDSVRVSWWMRLYASVLFGEAM